MGLELQLGLGKSEHVVKNFRHSFVEYYVSNPGLINTARRNCRVRIGLKVQFFWVCIKLANTSS